MAEPITLWQPTSGNGEMSLMTALFLTTLSGNQLVTKTSSNNLITGTSKFTQIPVTTWLTNDGT